MEDILVSIVIPVLTVMCTGLLTVYAADRRINNENRETHKPYLILHRVIGLDKINEYKYYLNFIGRNFHASHAELTDDKIINTVRDTDLSVEITLQNIGYGVATNIKFYDLLTGNDLIGTQANTDSKDQKLFTTLDAAVSEEKSIQARLINEVIKKDDSYQEEHNRILCVYKDLNNHTYTFIFGINVKANGHYDFFAYQPSSHSYKRWYKENQKEYEDIIKKYQEL